MSGQSFVVSPRSWLSIKNIVAAVRSNSGLQEEAYFPVVEFVEGFLCNRLGLFNLEIADYAEMNGAEGYTDPSGSFIMLREDVYEKAYGGDGRARFTVAHELGHIFLHTG